MSPRARLALPLAALALAGCAGSSAPAGGTLRVVAAEGFWGSLAAQVGGDRARVVSLVTSPDADPHDYEPRVADARTLAGARLAIVNGIGYDAWASRLIAANPVDGRIVLDVGDLLGLRPGDNPHQWYSPGAVRRVIGEIAADLGRLDPGDAAYFRRRRAMVQAALGPYRALIARIRARYAGTPVAASESVFAPLARALGLRLLTPPALLAAVGEGTDPTASDRQAAEGQITRRQVRVWVYNPQNATPDVRRLGDAAARAGLPIVRVTETPVPAGASFQRWQVAQLEGLERALRAAVGR